jgi:hypothetical protein
MENSASTSARSLLRDYLVAVGDNLARGNATEHTHRPALKAFIEGLGADIVATNEPRRVECGAPDFVITRRDLPVGYVEAKDVGRSLDEIERDEQLKRYRDGLSNLILTDYLEFRWYRDGVRVADARVAYVGGASSKLQTDKDGSAKAVAVLESFLAAEPPRMTWSTASARDPATDSTGALSSAKRSSTSSTGGRGQPEVRRAARVAAPARPPRGVRRRPRRMARGGLSALPQRLRHLASSSRPKERGGCTATGRRRQGGVVLAPRN